MMTDGANALLRRGTGGVPSARKQHDYDDDGDSATTE